MMNNKQFIKFIISSVVVLISAILPAVSGMWLYTPWFGSHYVHTEHHFIYFFSLPLFIVFSIVRSLVFGKNTFRFSEIFLSCVSGTVSAFMVLGSLGGLFDGIGDNITRHELVFPTIYSVILASIVLNCILVCRDIIKAVKIK